MCMVDATVCCLLVCSGAARAAAPSGKSCLSSGGTSRCGASSTDGWHGMACVIACLAGCAAAAGLSHPKQEGNACLPRVAAAPADLPPLAAATICVPERCKPRAAAPSSIGACRCHTSRTPTLARQCLRARPFASTWRCVAYRERERLGAAQWSGPCQTALWVVAGWPRLLLGSHAQLAKLPQPRS